MWRKQKYFSIFVAQEYFNWPSTLEMNKVRWMGRTSYFRSRSILVTRSSWLNLVWWLYSAINTKKQNHISLIKQLMTSSTTIKSPKTNQTHQWGSFLGAPTIASSSSAICCFHIQSSASSPFMWLNGVVWVHLQYMAELAVSTDLYCCYCSKVWKEDFMDLSLCSHLALNPPNKVACYDFFGNIYLHATFFSPTFFLLWWGRV